MLARFPGAHLASNKQMLEEEEEEAGVGLFVEIPEPVGAWASGSQLQGTTLLCLPSTFHGKNPGVFLVLFLSL